jgi:hypothetical protein
MPMWRRISCSRTEYIVRCAVLGVIVFGSGVAGVLQGNSINWSGRRSSATIEYAIFELPDNSIDAVAYRMGRNPPPSVTGTVVMTVSMQVARYPANAQGKLRKWFSEEVAYFLNVRRAGGDAARWREDEIEKALWNATCSPEVGIYVPPEARPFRRELPVDRSVLSVAAGTSGLAQVVRTSWRIDRMLRAGVMLGCAFVTALSLWLWAREVRRIWAWPRGVLSACRFCGYDRGMAALYGVPNVEPHGHPQRSRPGAMVRPLWAVP